MLKVDNSMGGLGGGGLFSWIFHFIPPAAGGEILPKTREDALTLKPDLMYLFLGCFLLVFFVDFCCFTGLC